MFRLRIAYGVCAIVLAVFFTIAYQAYGISRLYFEPALIVMCGLFFAFLTYKKSLDAALSDWDTRLKDKKAAESEKIKGLDELKAFVKQATEKEMALVKLYEATKGMSASLKFDDIFNLFGVFLKESFRFRKCGLFILRGPDDDLHIEKRYEVWGIGEEPKSEADLDYDKIIRLYMQYKREIYFVRENDPSIFDDLKVGPEVRSIMFFPLSSEKKVVGILSVENFLSEEVDRFSVLATQFALEIRKVLLYETIEELAITDGLTSLYVRRYFFERLNEELNRSKRYKFKFACLMIDIDDFKKTNDSYGHLVGDAILRALGRIIKESVREIDIAARYGGEEFSLILPETPSESAMLVAERIRKKVEEKVFRVYDEKIKTTISIGVSVYPEDALKGKDLVGCADKALYAAKAAGKNVVRYYKSIV